MADYLSMDFSLVIIPDLPASEKTLNRQQEAHLLRFEDASLWVDQRNTFFSKEESEL
jgi:hypothetical protein